MGGFSVTPLKQTKITGLEKPAQDIANDEKLTAIVKVKKSGYVPDNMELRSRIDETMFTAEFYSQLIESLEEDEAIESVSISKETQIVD